MEGEAPFEVASSLPRYRSLFSQVGMLSRKAEKRMVSSIFIILAPPRRGCGGPAKAPPFLPTEKLVPRKEGRGASSTPGAGEAPDVLGPRAPNVVPVQSWSRSGETFSCGDSLAGRPWMDTPLPGSG